MYASVGLRAVPDHTGGPRCAQLVDSFDHGMTTVPVSYYKQASKMILLSAVTSRKKLLNHW